MAATYRDLLVWQRAMDLVMAVYDGSKRFPTSEAYGLTSQIRRAAVSVPSNIAEGRGRQTVNEVLHHLRIAHGSLSETETQVLIAQRLNYLDEPSANELLALTDEVGRLLRGLANSYMSQGTSP